MFITMKELKMHDTCTWVQRDDADGSRGPEVQFHHAGWGWFNRLFDWIFNNFV